MNETGSSSFAVRRLGVDTPEAILRVQHAARNGALWSILRKRFALTQRESEVALLLAHRATNSEIAEELGISAHTSRHHTQSVLYKTRLQSRAQLRRFLGDLTNEE